MAKTVKAKSATASAKKAASKKPTTAPKKVAAKKTASKQAAPKKAAATKKSAVLKPVKKAVQNESELLADIVIKGILEKKGKNIVSFDLRNLKSTVSDFFIICHADSPNQVTAIADSVEETVRKVKGEKPWHSEGYENAEWLLIDYSNVVVHIFRTEQREFYGLEKLWADAEVTKVAESF
jgi:ribosome-associated protein